MLMTNLKTRLCARYCESKWRKTPIEPKSLVPLVADKSVKDREKDQAFITLLANTFKPSDINWQDYDVIYYTGGHGVMWDF